MRCSKCGKKVKKNSSFCINCGAKLPPAPKKAKKKKNKKKGSKAKILIPFFLVLLIAALAFLLFGGDRVPEKIRELKVYSQLTETVKEKLPDQIKLPFDISVKLPFDFSIKLPFDLPDPSSLLGDSKIPDKKKITEDLSSYKGKDSKAKFDSLEIEKQTTDKKGKQDIVYVAAQTKGDTKGGGEPTTSYYRLEYKRHLIGGWKLDTVKPYNVKGEKTSVAGVDNKTVVGDQNLYADIPIEWKHSNIKVMGHDTDLKAGTDTVVVYMELKNNYVDMTGTKEITYHYNDGTRTWETGDVSKLNCTSIKPVAKQ